jgi:hypothetical protein
MGVFNRTSRRKNLLLFKENKIQKSLSFVKLNFNNFNIRLFKVAADGFFFVCIKILEGFVALRPGGFRACFYGKIFQFLIGFFAGFSPVVCSCPDLKGQV